MVLHPDKGREAIIDGVIWWGGEYVDQFLSLNGD